MALFVVMIDLIDAIWELLQGEIMYRGARILLARTTQHWQFTFPHFHPLKLDMFQPVIDMADKNTSQIV